MFGVMMDIIASFAEWREEGGGNVKMISHACPSCRRAGLVACVVGVFGWVVFPKQVVWKCVPHTYKKNRV